MDLILSLKGPATRPFCSQTIDALMEAGTNYKIPVLLGGLDANRLCPTRVNFSVEI